MAHLLIHDFSSHILSQGTGFATAAPVSAGTAGRGMHVRSGWVQSTNEERGCCNEGQGGLAAWSNQSNAGSCHHPLPRLQKSHMEVILPSVFLLYRLQIALRKLDVVGLKKKITL